MQPAALIGCAVAILAWGSAGIFDKLGVKNVDPFSAVLVRMVFGTLVILLVCAATGRLKPIASFEPRTIGFLCASALLGGLIGQVAYFVAVKYAPVTQVIPITATYPVIAVIFATVILREHLTLPRIAGVVLVVAGLMLVSSGNSKGAAEGSASIGAVAEQGTAHDASESAP